MDRKRFDEVRSGGQNKCNGCGLIIKRYHVDHIHPRSRSGTNDPDNLQILCAFCNLSKGALTMREWCAIPNTRGYLFWRGREDFIPRGRTRDPDEQRQVEQFDQSLFAKELWDRNVNLSIPATVDSNWYLLYLMRREDADDRIQAINLFSSIKILGDQVSLQEARKAAKDSWSELTGEWPPNNWRDDPRVPVHLKANDR